MSLCVADLIFEHPRLVSIYDALDPDRSDLDPYLGMVEEFGAKTVLDLGCGTGVLALLLAARGIDVAGVDPAAGSLDVARAKPGATGVRWIQGDGTSLPAQQVDLCFMTGNAAQAITSDRGWQSTLAGVFEALKPGGRFIFETRDPARKAWEEWTEMATRRVTLIEGVGEVESWVEPLGVDWPLVRIRWNYFFAFDSQLLTSDSTLCFRDKEEAAADLRGQGFQVEEVRDAPDRPSREFVFIARRPK